jgi:hypothetical protein
MGRALYLVLILALAGCDGAVRDPTGLGGGDGGGTTIGGGGGGGGGGGNSGSPLLGTWETHFVFQLSGDVQRHTVTWTFSPDGTCRRVIEIYSVLEDRTLTTEVSCTFRSGGSQVSVTFDGHTLAATFPWSLEHFSPDRLVLDGVTYDRLS